MLGRAAIHPELILALVHAPVRGDVGGPSRNLADP